MVKSAKKKSSFKASKLRKRSRLQKWTIAIKVFQDTVWWPFLRGAHTPQPMCFPYIQHVLHHFSERLIMLHSVPFGFLVPDIDLIIVLSKVIYMTSNSQNTTNGHLSGHFYTNYTQPLHRSSNHFNYTHCP